MKMTTFNFESEQYNFKAADESYPLGAIFETIVWMGKNIGKRLSKCTMYEDVGAYPQKFPKPKEKRLFFQKTERDYWIF